MKITAIVIEDWKLPIFVRHLVAGGFSYSAHPNLPVGSMVLKVRTPTIAILQPVVEAAQLECKPQ